MSDSNTRQKGFSLLEVLLASVILLVGITAITRLTGSMLEGLSGSAEASREGVMQHAEVVEHLLSEQAELIRSQTSLPAPTPTIAPLVVPNLGQYVVAEVSATDQTSGAFTKRLYRFRVTFEPVGAASISVGEVTLNKLIGGAGGRTGL